MNRKYCPRRRPWWLRAGLLAEVSAITLLCAGAASAQEQATQIENVVVTAQRTAQRLQDVPMSVQAITLQQMQIQGISTGADLNAMVPNLSVGSNQANNIDTTVSIRGIPEVGLYVDGIWQPDVGFREGGIIEMQRTEILRGPQGTLFGRNTNGGAINYITVPPADKFGINGSFEVGSYGRRFVNVSVDVPLSDTLLTKWTAAIQHQGGWLKSVTNQQWYGGYDDKVFRGDIEWKPTSYLMVRLTANQTDTVGTDPRVASFTNVTPGTVNPTYTTLYNVAMMNPAYGPYNFWTGSTEWLSRFRAANGEWSAQNDSWNFPGGRVGKWGTTNDVPLDSKKIDESQYTLTATWNINANMTLTNLTSYLIQTTRHYTNFFGGDIGGLRDLRMWRSNYWTEEVHLEGDFFDKQVHFLLGGYYLGSRERQRHYRWGLNEFYLPNPAAVNDPIVQNGLLPVLDPALANFIHQWGVANGNATMASFGQPGSRFPHDFEDGQQPRNSTDYNNMLVDNSINDYAVFGNVTWHVTSKLDLQAGVRLAWDSGTDKTVMPTGAYRAYLTPELGSGTGYGPGPLFSGSTVERSNNPYVGGVTATPMATASYHFTPDVMGFLRYAQGFTAGTTSYNTLLAQYITLDPEVVHDYEAGIRSDWFNHRLRANVTGYWMIWDGRQIEQSFIVPSTGAFVVVNTSGGKGRARGFEAQLQALPIQGLQLEASVAYLNTSWLKYDNTTVGPNTPWAYAPEWTFHLSGQYDIELPNMSDVTLRADYGYVGSYQINGEIYRQIPGGEPAYGILNARIQYTPSDAHWNVQLFGTNLTDSSYISGGLNDADVWGVSFQYVGQRRLWGVRVAYNY